MQVIDERDWIVKFPLNIPVEPLVEYAHKVMQDQGPGTKGTTGEHDDGYWWMEKNHPDLDKRLREICPLNDDEVWHKVSIWEWPRGGILNQHTDGLGRGASMVTVIKGRFEIFTHDEETGEIVDSCVYGPGEIMVLKNGHRRPHSGRCLDDYRLAICTFASNEPDLFRDYGEPIPCWTEHEW